jgi:hypothetical protein
MLLRPGPQEYSCVLLGNAEDRGIASERGLGGSLYRASPRVEVPASVLPAGLKISVVLRYGLTYAWAPEAWREVRQHIPWLLAEQDRIRKPGASTDSGIVVGESLFPFARY